MLEDVLSVSDVTFRVELPRKTRVSLQRPLRPRSLAPTDKVTHNAA